MVHNMWMRGDDAYKDTSANLLLIPLFLLLQILFLQVRQAPDVRDQTKSSNVYVYR